MDKQVEPSIRAILGLDKTIADSRALFLKRGGFALAALAIVGLVLVIVFANGAKQTQYVTRTVARGDLRVTISATGTLQPVQEVSVGTEVSGTIDYVAVENNDTVKAGELLARIDPTRLNEQVRQARASLASASADERQARATVTEANSAYSRTKKLTDADLMSKQSLEAARATRDRALAGVDSARSRVSVAQADLKVSQTNLAKAEIHSPIDGIVLERSVDPGQTVTASLQTPVLFRLAGGLKSMELHVDVDEADVGKAKTGQSASFTVDAYPQKRFSARITRVRLSPTTTAGVVTYETLLAVDNEELLLRPGMTATAIITVSEVKNALLVANEALRFTPASMAKASTSSSSASGGIVGQLMPRMGRPGGASAPTNVAPSSTVWVLRDGAPLGVPVKLGQSDGRNTQVLTGALAVGDKVIVDATGPA